MNRAGKPTRQCFRTSLLLLLAVFAMPANASEQPIFPDVKWHIWGGVFTSAAAAFAYVNERKAADGLPPATDLRPCIRGDLAERRP